MEGQLFEETFPANIVYRPHRGAGKERWGVAEGQQSARKSQCRSERCFKLTEDLSFEMLEPLLGCDTQPFGKFYARVEDVPFLRLDWTKTFKHRQRNKLWFWSALPGEVGGNTQLRSTHRFLQ